MEMDPDSSVVSKVTVDEESKIVANANPRISDEIDKSNFVRKQEVPLVSVSALNQGQDIETKTADSVEVNLSSVEDDEGRRPSGRLKNHPGKRKVKVDWTPELHKRFVKAVEQLGVDKAVPSKILELMGIDCLNRHNVASHLQKYRRKHLLARVAEASRWNRRQQIFGTTKNALKRNVHSCAVPMTTGFPQVESVQHVAPLHVWGHPYADQSVMYTWSNQITPPPVWLPAHHQPPGNTSSWYCPHQDVPALGMPCFPHYPSMRLDTPSLPMYMYRGEPAIGVPIVSSGQTLLSHSPVDSPPSKETIDAAIGDVLSKPWLPLPLGLKPPSIDGVMVELHRQGISKISSQRATLEHEMKTCE